MWLLEEAYQHGAPVLTTQPQIQCKVFEDNEGVIEIAKVPTMRLRTKHLSIKYRHFREEVKNGSVSIFHVGTKDWTAVSTNPLDEALFMKHREMMMGW